MKFEKTYIIGARETGRNNHLTNYGFLAFLENVAVSHSDTVGYGIKDIWTKKRAWILMDWELEVKKRPTFGEKITCKTWGVNIEKATFHVYRNFEVFDENQELIATATSKWVLYDIENNKIVKIDKEFYSIFNPEGKEEAVKGKLEKIKELEDYSNVCEYTVKRFDIDMNNHMHNLNYLNLAYEALPEDVYMKEDLNNIHIMYKHQLKFGDTVKCFYRFEDGKHYVTIKNENTVNSIISLWTT